MRSVRSFALFGAAIFLLGCGKSSKLTALLPDAPTGWSAEGSAVTKDVSGIGHSSTRSYVPSGTAANLGIQRVSVQLLLAEKGADPKKIQEMSLESKGDFKEQKQVGGYRAYESFPLPSNETHSLDIVPRGGTYVQIVAYKGGAGWEKGENRQAAVAAFADKTDLKKIAAME